MKTTPQIYDTDELQIELVPTTAPDNISHVIQEAQVSTNAPAETKSDLGADGGYIIPEVGSCAIDRDRGAEVIVIEIKPGRAATDVAAFQRDSITVADLNPKYDEGAPPIRVVYADPVDHILSSWESVDELCSAVDNGVINDHYFPADRLAVEPLSTVSVAGGTR